MNKIFGFIDKTDFFKSFFSERLDNLFIQFDGEIYNKESLSSAQYLNDEQFLSTSPKIKPINSPQLKDKISSHIV